MPVSSSNRWASRTSIPSKGCRRRFPSSRRAPATIPARRSARSRRFTIICACSLPASGVPTVFSAARRSPRRPSSRWSMRLRALPEGSKFQILAPIVRGRKGEYRKELLEMRRAGYVRARIDGKLVDLGDDITLDKQKKHTIEIVVDRLVMKPGDALDAPAGRFGRDLAETRRRARRRADGGRRDASCTAKSWPASAAASVIRKSRRASFPSIARMEPVRPATASGMPCTPGARTMRISRCWNPARSARARGCRPESLSVKIARKSIAEVTRSLGAGRGRFFQLAEIHRTRTGDCPSDLERDSRTARVSRQRRVGLSDAGSGGRDACPVEKASASGWPRKSARDSSASSTSWMSRRSVCISGTIGACSRPAAPARSGQHGGRGRA